MRRVRLGTDLSLAGVGRGTDLSRAGVGDPAPPREPLSAQVMAHDRREPMRAARTRNWMPVAGELFELAPLDDCDVAVLPFAWEDTEAVPERRRDALSFLDRAARAGCVTLVFSQSDRPEPVPRDDVVVFGHALHRSSLRAQEVVIPAWIDDPFPDGLPPDNARRW